MCNKEVSNIVSRQPCPIVLQSNLKNFKFARLHHLTYEHAHNHEHVHLKHAVVVGPDMGSIWGLFLGQRAPRKEK